MKKGNNWGTCLYSLEKNRTDRLLFCCTG